MIIVKNIAKNTAIKCPYEMKPSRIVVHNTYNDATARNEVSYMSNRPEKVSFHYAVDDKEIVQGIEENRNGFHAGDGINGKGNREGISIEICYSKSGGDRFIKAEKLAVKLIVDILKRYGWGIDRVTKHQDYSRKNCPHRTLSLGWDRFINMIRTELEPTNSQKTIKKDKYKVNSILGLRVRYAPTTTSKIVRVLKNGTVIEADKIVNGWVKIKDGYLSMQYLKKV